MFKHKYLFPGLAILTLLFFSIAVWAAYDENREIELGKQAAQEIEKQFPVLNSLEKTKYITDMAAPIIAISERPKLSYTFKLLDTADVNAFSLPGGFVYLTRGLMDFVQSEHELAAVIAHEIAHTAHYHCLETLEKQSKMDKRILLWLGVLVATGGGASANVDMGDLLYAALLVREAVLNGYSREYEMEADYYSVQYLYKSKKYNPVGVLTFMEHFARLENRKPKINLGIFQTHPGHSQRVADIEKELHKLGVKINRRLVTQSISAQAEPVKINDKEIAQVLINKNIIFQPASPQENKTILERAQKTADLLNQLFLADLKAYEIKLKKDGENVAITARNQTLLEIYPADAQFHNTTVDKLSEEVLKKLKKAFWEETINTSF